MPDKPTCLTLLFSSPLPHDRCLSQHSESPLLSYPILLCLHMDHPRHHCSSQKCGSIKTQWPTSRGMHCLKKSAIPCRTCPLQVSTLSTFGNFTVLELIKPSLVVWYTPLSSFSETSHCLFYTYTFPFHFSTFSL